MTYLKIKNISSKTKIWNQDCQKYDSNIKTNSDKKVNQLNKWRVIKSNLSWIKIERAKEKNICIVISKSWWHFKFISINSKQRIFFSSLIYLFLISNLIIAAWKKIRLISLLYYKAVQFWWLPDDLSIAIDYFIT